ncbi:MAG: hypothetical protein HHJ15_01595 [Rhodoferax sp.]|nr:hypothetical protein [Rhodoferax sp.]NMM18649.1 hypothetical protein [Rhodoferax sp.]
MCELLAEGERLAVRVGEVLDGRAPNFDNHQQDRKLRRVHQSKKSAEML